MAAPVARQQTSTSGDLPPRFSLGAAQSRVVEALEVDPVFFLNEPGFEAARHQKLKHCCKRVRVWRKNAPNPLVAFRSQMDLGTGQPAQKKERRIHVAVLLNGILDAYEQCITRYDDILAIESLPEYFANTIMQKANGRKNGVDQVQATIAAMLHATAHPRVRAFSNLCGLKTDADATTDAYNSTFNPPEKTVMFLRCVEKIFRVKLRDKAVGEIDPTASSIASIVFHNIGLPQAAAKIVVHELFNEPDPYWAFQYLEPVCGELHAELVDLVSKQTSSSRGMRKIDGDLFLELLLQTWNRRAMQLYSALDAACDAEDADSARQVRQALDKCALDKKVVPLQPFEVAGFQRIVEEFWLADVPWHDPAILNEYLFGCTRPIKEIRALFHAFRDECSPALASTWAWETWPWESEWDWGSLELLPTPPIQSPSSLTRHGSTLTPPSSQTSSQSDSGHLNLGHFGLGDRVMQKVGQFLNQSTSSRRRLKTLVLHDNSIADKGCATIIHAVTHAQHALVTLDLSNNRIHADGIAALSDAVQSPKCQLQTLLLSKNRVGDVVGRSLLTALANNLTLQTVDLSENGLQACGHAVALVLRSHPKLRQLDLSWNLLRGSHAVAVAMSLGDNNCLESLNVSSNAFGEAGMLALAQALTRNTALRMLNVGHNSIHSVKDVSKLSKLLRANSTLHTLVLSGNPFGETIATALSKLNRPSPQLHLELEGCTLTTSSTYALPKAREDGDQGAATTQVDSVSTCVASGSGASRAL
ncbi:hypothetical protein DYB32_002000 [Aphanomyces invadans]|uniref:Uncharacterized protein n=1 Tax=Aphanomyces invadans TaxID=157072 RepID=A0A3R6VF56_9STRA|nr:hypothetical protein DYB32_002000 [Aphanomyces invadans]